MEVCLLIILMKCRRFANKKFTMDRILIEQKFGLFVQMLDRAGSLSFADMCGRLGVTCAEMDSYLLENFGLTGPDILKVYREGIPLYLL